MTPTALIGAQGHRSHHKLLHHAERRAIAREAQQPLPLGAVSPATELNAHLHKFGHAVLGILGDEQITRCEKAEKKTRPPSQALANNSGISYLEALGVSRDSYHGGVVVEGGEAVGCCVLPDEDAVVSTVDH